MSCGTKLEGRFGGYYDREELERALEREGEYRLAREVRYNGCLDTLDLHRAERALDRQGFSSFDYRKKRCYCESDQDDY